MRVANEVSCARRFRTKCARPARVRLDGQEKFKTALASAQAVGVRMLMLNQEFAAFVFKQMLSASVALMYIATSRTAVESVERQSRLVRDSMKSSVATAANLSGSTAQLARRALKAVHTRVSGNARRLGRR